jgi:predicted MPP superfamily phosphohydrolase
MKNKLVLIVFGLMFSACATYEVKYKNLEKFQSTAYPGDKKLSQRFYLIGDTGYEKLEEAPPGILAFKAFAESLDTQNDKVIILGDNIYPAGLPSKGEKNRNQAKEIIDRQTSNLAFFEGDIHFIPGNHDWYSEGIQSLENQEKQIKKVLKKELKSKEKIQKITI